MIFNFNAYINTLGKCFKVLLVVFAILGGLAAACYFVYLPQEKEQDARIDRLLNQLDPPPLPPMEYVDGLPQLNDSQKRDIFETGMKLRDEHENIEAIEQFRLLLSMNMSDEERASLLILIGNCFLLTGNQDEALENYKKALKAAENIYNPSAKGVALVNIGHIYRDKDEADEALKYNQQVLEIFESIRAEHQPKLTPILKPSTPVEWNSNFDGYADAWDLNFDGYADAWDLNFDGYADAWDLNFDGYADAWDLNFDGYADAWDLNFDGYTLRSFNGS